MFRKLVVNLTYSPSSIEQLGTYSSKLKREQVLRETGLIFLGFSAFAIGFAVFSASTNSGAPDTSKVEEFVSMFSRDLPNISIEISLIIFTTLLAISLLLYLRSHLLYKEIREIRRGFNSGAIETSTSEKKLSKLNFANIMNMVRKNLSVFWRIFSRFSHSKPVEIMFSFFANIIARPLSMLIGGLFAAIFTTVMFLFAKYYGFQLSGSEWIAGFILGWVFGNFGDWISEGFAKHPDDL